MARANKAKMLDAIEFKLLNPTATQAQVAEIIGITDRQLRNWENEETILDLLIYLSSYCSAVITVI